MEDKQRQVFNTLMQKELPALVNGNTVNIADDVDLQFQLLDTDLSHPITDENGTVYVPISVTCTLRDNRTTESASFNVNLLNMPVYQELGFCIRGNYMQMLDSYDKAAGLHTSRKQTQSKDDDKAVIQAENFKSVGFCRSKSKYLAVLDVKSRVSDAIEVSPVTFLRAVSGMSKEELLAKFSCSNSFVVSLFDDDPHTRAECKAGYPSETGTDCIHAVYAGIFGKAAERNPDNGTISIKREEIRKWLFNPNYFKKGSYAIQRVRYMQSFSYRASGAVLAEPVNSNGIEIAAGTVLTTQLLRELDATELQEIVIEHNNTNYVLHRFARYWFGGINYTILEDVPSLNIKSGDKLTLEDIDELNISDLVKIRVRDLNGNERVLSRDVDETALTLDDLFAVFDIWVNNLSGLDAYDKEFDLTNRILVPFSVRVIQLIKDYMNTIAYKISTKYTVKGNTVNLADYIENFDKYINVEAFIDQIRSPELKLGQMAEMCNIMSFTSKNYKSTIANLKNIDDNLVAIQDHQYGRTDPFDVPESQKLASVQHRTMNSKLNESGSITVPYLRVHNGEIVSETPVYLTATEETDRYIAEWNETFKNPDGSKKQHVMVRYNGEIVSVATDNVSYREMSPYDGMSIAHACAPFPGHSDGKRITMECNQVLQATPMAHKHRPTINAGGESMVDYGFYAADSILQNFYDREVQTCPALEPYRSTILSSKLKLTSKRTRHGQMILTFKVLAMDEVYDSIQSSADVASAIGIATNDFNKMVELSVPYASQTTDNTLMTYEINPMPGNVYSPDDIVCCSNSCSSETKEHNDCLETGALTLDRKKLDKGLALVTELRIGYKTWSGSTIDDAMIISDECVFGDVLTSIFTTRIVVTAKTFSETEFERFGRGAGAPTYFEENGLPKIGTYLAAGDPVVCKIVTSKGTAKVKYKCLSVEQSGQVVHAAFTTKNSEMVAEVVLAQRNVTEVGDKYAGRCGNKGVVAKIVPAEQMPFDPETGFRLQAILNPLGVPSRGNLSQFLDMDATECLRQENKIGYVSPYNKNDLQWVMDLKKIHNVKPKIFIDGRTGKPFERPIHWGTLPMYKLHHMIKKKYHAIGLTAPVDPVYMQPRQGAKMDGGQSFGEMEAWCLMSINATNVLQEIYGYQSTDIRTRNTVRSNLEHGMESIGDVRGNNSNDATMLVCYRSLGIDFKTNTEDQVFEFRPLTDEAIRALSATPVDNVENLHNANIFKGYSAKLEDKDQARSVWSWIDLKVPMIHPNFIKNSNILRFICANVDTFNADVADDLMRGYLAVEEVTEKVDSFTLCMTALMPSTRAEHYGGMFREDEISSKTVTGPKALAMMFRYMDTEKLEQMFAAGMQEWLNRNGYTANSPELVHSSKYQSLLKRYNAISQFNKEESLADYVISSFPVMPQIYRPRFAASHQTDHVDFDWHYARILAAVAAYERNNSVESEYAIYDAICAFCGLKAATTNEEKKHKNIKTYFRGPDGENGDHGKLRTHVQSKRVYCSGRTTIIPAHDTRMKPTEIGVPIVLATQMYESPLIGKLRLSIYANFSEDLTRETLVRLLMQCAKRNRTKFNRLWEKDFAGKTTFPDSTAYEEVTQMIIDYVEGNNGNDKQVVLCGRQPSLHKYAIRAYRPKIVFENTINVHTLVCTGYNADFDGDQMWVHALLQEKSKEEAIRLMSPSVDYINPKDSSLILKHTQDVVLGLYCVSMLKNNATSIKVELGDIHHYANMDHLIMDLESENVHAYDIACVTYNDHKYLGTVGRLYLNHIVNGFTDEVFTNPLQIPGIKCENYCEMRYDGIWRSGGNVKTGNFRYFKIADVCLDCYNEMQEHCIDIMQKLTEVGFLYADKFAISLSLEDMMLEPVDAQGDDSSTMSDPKLIDLGNRSLDNICSEALTKADELRVAIERDYFDGLVSEDDKNDAIMALFYNGTGDSESEFCSGIHSDVQKQILDKLRYTQRNNNLFIMLDSGARGKADQIMRMCGFLPQLQKDKGSSLKTPVTHSFLQGLSSFDVHMTSYGIKQGLASTQNETPDAGYATHKGVYMVSGLKVVENDCGKQDWWYDVKYADIDDSKSRFMPTRDWFNEHLLGKTVNSSDKETIEMFNLDTANPVITEDNFADLITAGGFHSVEVHDGVYDITVDSLVGHTILSTDKDNAVKLANTLKNKKMTAHSVRLVQDRKIRKVSTPEGSFEFKYKMDPCSKSLMLHRQCKDLPYTAVIRDANGTPIDVTTEETIKYIEQENLTRVPVRILLDCECEHGVCAHCYGLKFSSLKFPEIGDFVGTESAQAIGEPSAQLTISLINQGGTAGAAIDDGVKRFNSLLDGSVKNPAIIAPRSGYVRIEKLGKFATVSVRPVDGKSDMCYGCNSGVGCPMFDDAEKELPPCAIKQAIDVDLLTCKDGDWVEASQPLTMAIPNPIDITVVRENDSLDDTTEFKYVYRRKQTTWLQNYYETFSNKGIDINARHFEIFARVQNLHGTVTYSEDPRFVPGKSYEIMSLQKADGNVIYTSELSSRQDVIKNVSGAMAALSFERVQSIAASLCVEAYDGSYVYNNSLLGSVAVGTDLVTGNVKSLAVPLVSHKNPRKIKATVFKPITYKEVDTSNLESGSSPLDDFDFEALLNNPIPAPVTTEASAETTVPETIPTVETVKPAVETVNTSAADTTVPTMMDFGALVTVPESTESIPGDPDDYADEDEEYEDFSEIDSHDYDDLEDSDDDTAERVDGDTNDVNTSDLSGPMQMSF